MEKENFKICPFCKSKIPSSLDKCPVCHRTIVERAFIYVDGKPYNNQSAKPPEMSEPIIPPDINVTVEPPQSKRQRTVTKGQIIWPISALINGSLMTILAVLGTIMIFTLLNNISGFILQSFTLFFIIPIGGICVGIGSVSGLFYSFLHYKKSITYKPFIIAIILSVVAFYGIYYASYLTTYVSPDNNINYWFKGEHISNYEIDGERVTFSKYLEVEKSSAKITSTINLIPIGEFETGKTLTMIRFYLHLLGAMLGCVGFGLFSQTKQDYKTDVYRHLF